MTIEALRQIGSNLIKESKGLVIGKTALGRGAAGDWTYPIDKLAEDIIIKGLKETGGPLTIISEEAGTVEFNCNGPDRKYAIIDPIDGSRNAVLGIPFYCSSIAITKMTSDAGTIGDVGLTYVINLITGEEFWAERGKGAFHNGDRISVQSDDMFHLAAYEASTPAKDIPTILPVLSKARKTRCFGATALSLCYLATGAVSVLLIPSPSRSFDFAGGWLIVKEAGGVVTDMEGNDIGHVRLGVNKATPLLASANERLHREALLLLK